MADEGPGLWERLKIWYAQQGVEPPKSSGWVGQPISEEEKADRAKRISKSFSGAMGMGSERAVPSERVTGKN